MVKDFWSAPFFGQLESDVVHVRSGLEITGGIRIWLEWPVRLIVFEDDDRVGTGELTFRSGTRREKTSRNCSSRTPTCRISFSFALPISRKFFERTLVQLSLAETGADESAKETKDNREHKCKSLCHELSVSLLVGQTFCLSDYENSEAGEKSGHVANK